MPFTAPFTAPRIAPTTGPSTGPSHPVTARAGRMPAWPMALCATAVLLAACGGGSDTPATPTPPAKVAISGVVADGPLHGATVCHDDNDNGACDAGEPQAVTDADGKYNFDVLASAAGQHAVLASVPATAIDKDTGVAVGTAFTLKAPPSGNAAAQSVFVSPLTTVVADIAKANGSSVADATAQVQAQLGLSVSPLADFTAAGANAGLGQAARAVGRVMVSTAKLAADAGVAAGPAATLVREAASQQLGVVAAALAAAPAEASVAERSAAAAAAVADALNLSAGTVAAVAGQLALPAGTGDAAGPFISVRRFAYTDANNYSYVIFTGDSSQTDGNGRYSANELRRNLVSGVDIPFSRNQMYWTGSSWLQCEDSWQVITGIKLATATTPQQSTYCGARNDSQPKVQDIAGKTLREVITTLRAYPLRDSVGSGTDATGLPVNWGPDPALLPADAVFPAGAQSSARSTTADIGNTDRIELTVKPTVRWADGVYRQATTLEQYSGMPGNLVDAAATITFNNTAYVDDEPFAGQPDAALDKVKRWRIGLDVAGNMARFYRCDLRIADQASINCAAMGDGTLAISTQGDIRLLRVASGYPAALTAALYRQRFWAEHAGTVFRGTTDLQRTRYDQRLNMVAWNALRTVLGIPAHTAATAPVANGPYDILRIFSFNNLDNYNWRSFTGDDSVVDGNGNSVAIEQRKSVANGVEQALATNRSYWTGTEWYDCPATGATVSFKVAPPSTSTYCKAYMEERVLAQPLLLSLGGRLMSDVVNDIRAYGSLDSGNSASNWGPQPSANPQLASTRFPAGATMEYRGLRRVMTDSTIGTAATDQVRVAPSPTSGAASNTWPFATSLENMIANYPGSLLGSAVINGNVALFVGSFTEAPSNPAYTSAVEIRVAFDANGNKARFTRNNRSVSTGVTTNYSNVLDTTYSITTVGGVRLLKFAAMPAGFEARLDYSRQYAERLGGVWYAYDNPAGVVNWSVRLNGTAKTALFSALGIQ